MKKIIAFAMAFAAMFAIAEMYEPGLTGEFTKGGIIKGAIVTSTNLTQQATVKAVYDFPLYGTVSSRTVEKNTYNEAYDKVEVLTNWCDYTSSTAVTNVSGSVTNVVYYDGIQTVTNIAYRTIVQYVTNTVSTLEVVGYKSITNDLYSLTASGGVGTNTTEKLLGAGGRLLIGTWPVTIFWE